jgi:hypothetical protein
MAFVVLIGGSCCALAVRAGLKLAEEEPVEGLALTAAAIRSVKS